MTSEIAGQRVQYKLTLKQDGINVSGTAEITGSNITRTVEGKLQTDNKGTATSGTRLNFRQKGDNIEFACACEFSPDFNGMIKGKIREMPGGTVGGWTAKR